MQDKIVVDIGRIAMKSKGNLQPFQLFVQDVFPDKENYVVIVTIFKSTHEGLLLDRVDIENGNKKTFLKFGYRKGSSRGGDITITTKVSETFDKKLNTLKNNQIGGFIAVAEQIKNEQETHLLSAFKNLLENSDSYGYLQSQLQPVYDGLNKDQKKAAVFSVRFDLEDGSELYVSDLKTFQHILFASGTEDKSEKYNVRSEGYDQQCSICLEQKPLLYGFASPFKYFTVDKPGLVSGFFKQANTWKNYPICSDCSLPFELGRDYVSQHLQSYFYGRPFYMIPKLLVGNDEKLLGKLMRRMEDLYDEASVAKAQKIERSEDKIMELMAGNEDYFLVNLMFFEEDSKTKAIKIRLLLEEILPSRFRTLFVETLVQVNDHTLYKQAITIKKEKKDLSFSFGILKGFFDDDFLELVQKVFDGKALSREYVFSKFMEAIRTNYNKAQTSDDFVEPTAWTVLKAHLALRYFQQLQLVQYQNYTYMDTFESTSKDQKFHGLFKEFVSNNPDFFDNDLKVGVFGLGMLVKYTMNIQYKKLGSTPFEKKLKGYDLSLNDLSKIYTEALFKLRQYDASGYYQDLREQILPKFLLNKHNPDRISKNELSLYFVAGLEWAGQFKDKSEQEESQNTQN
jgi:CRISPR-associated protein Csh1